MASLYTTPTVSYTTYNDVWGIVNLALRNTFYQPRIVGGSIQVGAGDSAFYTDATGMWFGAQTYSSAPFRVNLAGVVRATSGTIGGWTLGTDTLTGGAATLAAAGYLLLGTGDDVARLDASDATYRLWIGDATAADAPFRVTKAGALTATSATITGTITATAGAIGGFDIGADYIRDVANSFGLASTVSADDDVRFWAGDTFANRATAAFRLTEAGSFYASSANISGTITATAGVIGGWYVGSTTLASGAVTAAANIVLDQSTGQIRVGPTTDTYLLLDGGTAQLRSSNYVSGPFGAGFMLSGNMLEVGNARIRGTLTTVVFEKQHIASVGGIILVSTGSDVLASDMTALDASTMTTNGKETFAVGDFLRINVGGNEEWFEVTNGDSAPTYTVTRDKAALYSANANPAWTAGTVVINYGPSGAGGIVMSASGTPKFDIFTHAGAPWSATTTQLRIGNLNGFLGYTTNLYGIAIGDATAFLKYDSTNGLRLKSTNSQIDVGVSGYVLGGQTAYATGTGFFLGNDSGSYKLSIGNTTEYIRWSGSSLLISGGFLALYPIGLATYAFASLPITIVDTGFQNPTTNTAG